MGIGDSLMSVTVMMSDNCKENEGEGREGEKRGQSVRGGVMASPSVVPKSHWK